MTNTEEHTMTTDTSYIIERDSTDAAYVDDIMRQAREDAADGATATVTYWDATSDPADPGWVRRTYTADADGHVESVDEIL